MQHIRTLQIALSVIASVLLVVHLIWPAIRIDAIAVSLLLIAILPWLSPLIKSVEVPGMGKVEFQELKDKVEEAQGAAQSALRKSEFASAEQNNNAANRTTSNTLVNDKLASLAKEYNDTRKQMPSSGARTVAMTSILRQMVDVSTGLTSYDVTVPLREANGGLRLTAYAYLFAKPDFSYLNSLVDSMTNVEKTPFGQYWAIQALGKILAARKNLTVDSQTLAKLKHFYSTIQVGTDRSYELRRVLKDLESSQINAA
jgi:hypothetical protein